MNVLKKLWNVTLSKAFSWMGSGGATVSGTTVVWNNKTSAPEHNSAIAACMSSITDAIVEAPWQIKREQKDYADPVPLVGHPIVKLLKRPNPFMTGRRLVQALAFSYKFDGNAYARKIWNANKTKVVELWYIPHYLITPICTPGQESDFISYYRLTTSRGVMRLEVDEVIHLRLGTDPADPKRGLSPMKALVKEYGADNEASDYAFYTLKTMGVASIFISPDGDDVKLSSDFKDELAAQVREKTTGKNRGGVVAFTQRLKVDKIGMSPKDIDVATLRRIPEERISAVLNVPAIVAGLGAGLARSTFANMAEARRLFTESCLGPMWDSFAEEFDAQLLPDFDGTSIPDEAVANSATDSLSFDQKKVKALQEDEDDKHNRYRSDFQSCLLKLGEARAALGYETDDSEKDMWYSDFSPGAPPQDPKVTGSAAKMKRDLMLRMRQSREEFERNQTEDEA